MSSCFLNFSQKLFPFHHSFIIYTLSIPLVAKTAALHIRLMLECREVVLNKLKKGNYDPEEKTAIFSIEIQTNMWPRQRKVSYDN